jgi:predicted nucleotidyltransferase
VLAQQGETSDLLVSFYQMPDLMTDVELENHPSATLGVRVGLLMERARKPRLAERILAEVVPLCVGSKQGWNIWKIFWKRRHR